MMRKDIILQSCDAATSHLKPELNAMSPDFNVMAHLQALTHMDPNAPEFPVLTYINTFMKAAGKTPHSPHTVSVNEAVRNTLLFLSTDFRGTLQAKHPRVWESLVALHPAACQLQGFAI